MTNEIMLVSLLFLGISFLVSAVLKSKFTKYSKIPLSTGLTGREVAERMLRENGIYDVQVQSSEGFLSDHYNPMDKTVNLSPDVYNNRTIAAAAVAAHECGHVVQHARAYPWLMFRSRMVPVVQVSSMLIQWVLLAGVLLINVFPQLLLVGILLFALTTVFALVTLPVEFDASRRARIALVEQGIVSPDEDQEVKKVLDAAALTYLAGTLTGILTLVYYLYEAGLLGGRQE